MGSAEPSTGARSRAKNRRRAFFYPLRIVLPMIDYDPYVD
jgi:hypothetical protein